MGKVKNLLQFCYVKYFKILQYYLEKYSTDYRTVFIDGLADSWRRF